MDSWGGGDGCRGESRLSAALQAKPQQQAERGGMFQAVWGVGGGQRECVSTPPHHRAAAGCQTEICGCGLTGTSLSGSVACTPHRAHRLIPRLKFTFAPSRLNSHFSSSHNTPVSRDTEMMGSWRALHAKRCTIAVRFWGVHINTVYQTLHE